MLIEADTLGATDMDMDILRSALSMYACTNPARHVGGVLVGELTVKVLRDRHVVETGNLPHRGHERRPQMWILVQREVDEHKRTGLLPVVVPSLDGHPCP